MFKNLSATGKRNEMADVEMEMSPRMEPVRERGMEVTKRERFIFRRGRDGQACCSYAMWR
jgi:hypothetical protein